MAGALRRKAVRGMTLIELLICIAIIAVTVAGANTVIHTAGIAQRRTRDWHEAVRLAETQIELFKGEGAPAEAGIHPIDPHLTERFKLAGSAEVEIRAATAGLREAIVRVMIRNESEDRVVTLRAYIPIRAAQEAPGA